MTQCSSHEKESIVAILEDQLVLALRSKKTKHTTARAADLHLGINGREMI